MSMKVRHGNEKSPPQMSRGLFFGDFSREHLIRRVAWLSLLFFSLPAQADIAAGEKKAETCMVCHGPNGNSSVATFPILAGQTFRYLYLQLKDFKEGRRSDPLMTAPTENLSRQDMLDLAEYFAAQKQKPNGFKADNEKAARGKRKADEVLCPMCHLGGFSGQNDIPRVAGQHFDYVVKQLEDFKARKRTNDAGNMTSVAGTLSDRDIADLANYIANLN
jgi:cytochrome c553